MASGRAAVAARTARSDPASEGRIGLLLTGVPYSSVPPEIREKAVVLITDDRDVAAFQIAGVNTEYLLNAELYPDRHPIAALERYLVRRLAILRVKWRLSALYYAGSWAEGLAAAWVADPEGPDSGFFRHLSVDDQTGRVLEAER